MAKAVQKPEEYKDLSWAEIEKKYRQIADGFLERANKLNSDADVTNESKVKVAYLKQSAKLVVQASKFYDLADNAKNYRWQDEAGAMLAELQANDEATPSTSPKPTNRQYH